MTRDDVKESASDPIIKPETTRRRRASSNLGGDPRGDTGVASLATFSHENRSLSDIAASPTADHKSSLTKTSKRRKAKSIFRRWTRFSLRHTWVNPLIVVLVIVSLYFLNPTPSNPFYRAIFLSYPIPPTSANGKIQYAKGASDMAFVLFYTIVLSFTREFIMQRLLRPLSIYFGIRSRGKQSRFMEQMYTAIYFAISGSVGLYIMSRSPVWYFNTGNMMLGYPRRLLDDGLFKAYYLLQASYWTQQWLVLVLMLEKPRKDFKELVLHHIITLSLIYLSYAFHYTYIGIAIYITHDISDFFLATSKSLHYIDSPIIIPYYTLFVAVWVYLRHYINIRIMFMTFTSLANPVGPFNYLLADGHNFPSHWGKWVCPFLLVSLQLINLFWLFLIMRILWRAVMTNVAEDERSEAGDEDVSEGEDERLKNEKDVDSGVVMNDVDVQTVKNSENSVRHRRPG